MLAPPEFGPTGSRAAVGLIRLVGLVAAVGVLAAGCGAAPLIPAEDAVFARGQQRLARTIARVEPSGAPVQQRVLFVQAEALYRYRYAFRERSALGHLARVAAIVSDLPVLQAVAGSLDLVDLRVRSTDAAVQLWETLLARWPHTPLRALTLYRLGWAYRSAGARGLPRRSGEEAFARLRLEAPGSPLARLSAAATEVPWRSKEGATIRSIIPGLGQLYVGERGSGWARIGVAVAALALVAVPAVRAWQRLDTLSWRGDWPLLTVGTAGALVLMIDYTESYEDALRGVVAFNERQEARFEARHPEAP